MALTLIKSAASAACVGIAALASLAACAQGTGDSDVLAAKEAAQRGQWKVLDSYRARLAGHILESYPAYWLLAGNVERSDPREVQAFLVRYADSPLAESLRREWLRALGAAGSWDLFRLDYPLVLGDDVEIACYSFQERLARGSSRGARSRGRPRWSTIRALSSGMRWPATARSPIRRSRGRREPHCAWATGRKSSPRSSRCPPKRRASPTGAIGARAR